MKKPELLVPAGDLEKLKTAVRFGADAIYVGAGDFSLRAAQTSFDLAQLKEGLSFARKNKVAVYLAMNIFAYDADLAPMMDYLEEAKKLGIDAAIVSDPGLINLIRQKYPSLKLHLSTQANTLNHEAVKFWHKQGLSRIVLGRELSLEQVGKIKKAAPKVELELFVHGAMCMSYSGRCLLSKYMTGRSANRGECTHPCRWQYRLKELCRPDEEFSIEEDSRGTYVMNSKDLCMIEHIPELLKTGIDSFKIEGRMKSAYYVAVVTRIYRRAIDAYFKDPAKYKFNPEWKQELCKISHRNYCTGFYLGEDDRENSATGSYQRDYSFVGVISGHDLKTQELEIASRNNFKVGDTLEIIDPASDEIKKLKISKIRTKDNEFIDQAHNGYQVFVKADFAAPVSTDSLLRKKI
ncbi:MAG: U32 family peptidase C-terminal domain-containing protein [Candidatus Saganbacteria bacterium]|nr:U32 family peptidase C-terminal domain-containing protein [Candidatus Saganbacteria bacterium]